MTLDCKDQVDFIQQYLHLNNNDLGIDLEIIGNLLVRISIDYLDLPIRDDGEPLPYEEFIQFILEDRKKKGETIPNATALQGLTLLSWLKGSQGDLTL